VVNVSWPGWKCLLVKKRGTYMAKAMMLGWADPVLESKKMIELLEGCNL